MDKFHVYRSTEARQMSFLARLAAEAYSLPEQKDRIRGRGLGTSVGLLNELVLELGIRQKVEVNVEDSLAGAASTIVYHAIATVPDP